MPEVYVVLGLNCVVAVFDAQHTTEEELEEQFPLDEYDIYGDTVYKNIKEFVINN